MKSTLLLAGALLVTLGVLPALADQSGPTLFLWPGTAPGDQGQFGEEKDTTTAKDREVAGKPVARIGNVSKPSITLFRPPPTNNTGAAVIVLPGGGYNILAYDLEGTEVCEWLNSLGVTGVLLKYRVPKRPGLEKYAAPLQDAQRAVGLVRQHASDWGVDPQRVGVIGFSAGGHLAAMVSNRYAERSYPAVDDADKLSCRPDFTLLIYPAYLTVQNENDKVAPELTLTSNTPPTFIAMAQDDPVRVETALFYAAGLRKAKVPFELHLYPTGGHGYGLRPSSSLVTTWPQRAADWLHSQNAIESRRN